MRFPQSVADEVLVKCGRHCCLCGEFAGVAMELHHIKPQADGGDNTAENCIPLCCNCHAKVRAYDSRHPKGRKITEQELKMHRDKTYALYSGEKNEGNGKKSPARIFQPNENFSVTLWGYRIQDKICPLLPGDMVMVACTTGVRKSLYLYHVVNTNLKRGFRVAYCCIKDKPLNVALGIIAENVKVDLNMLKRDMLSDSKRQQVRLLGEEPYNKNLVVIQDNEINEAGRLMDLVENSGADIVVIDDFNGVQLSDAESVEKFFYKLKSAAIQSNTLVFVIYSLPNPGGRPDKHPIMNDFPSDSYYRLFDNVHLLYKPEIYYSDDEYKDKLEVIVSKGNINSPYFIQMVDMPEISSVTLPEDGAEC